jgi:sugar phosphate isomerase/epimerase
VHDPGYKPFAERAVSDCFKASLAYSSRDRVNLIPVADETVKADPWIYLKFLDDFDPYFRLLAKDISVRQMAAGTPMADSDTDIRMRLLRPEEIGCLFPTNAGRKTVKETISRLVARMPPRRYWCIGGYVGGYLTRIWIFEAEESAPPESAIFIHLDDGVPKFYQVQRPESWRRDEGGVPIVSADQPKEASSKSPTGTKQQSNARGSAQVLPQGRLCRSVMTSCSVRYLPDLLAELQIATGGDVVVDLLMLRREDLRHMTMENVPIVGDSALSVLSNLDNVPHIVKWLVGHLRPRGARVAALATYVPQITSFNNSHRHRAIDALVGCVAIADRLCAEGLMAHPIVEIVCGTKTDRCKCPTCKAEQSNEITVSDTEAKLRTLIKSLKLLKRRASCRGVGEFYIAVEMEPGATYVLNSLEAMRLFHTMIQANPRLASHVGFNLDIAHMRIAEIEALSLSPLAGRILHAHISDHPFMHTRDQPVGKWTSVECASLTGYTPYLQLLANRMEAPLPDGHLPFSGAVALELEGCNRISWIRQSLGAMAHSLGAMGNHI